MEDEYKEYKYKLPKTFINGVLMDARAFLEGVRHKNYEFQGNMWMDNDDADTLEDSIVDLQNKFGKQQAKFFFDFNEENGTSDTLVICYPNEPENVWEFINACFKEIGHGESNDDDVFYCEKFKHKIWFKIWYD